MNVFENTKWKIWLIRCEQFVYLMEKEIATKMRSVKCVREKCHKYFSTIKLHNKKRKLTSKIEIFCIRKALQRETLRPKRSADAIVHKASFRECKAPKLFKRKRARFWCFNKPKWISHQNIKDQYKQGSEKIQNITRIIAKAFVEGVLEAHSIRPQLGRQGEI